MAKDKRERIAGSLKAQMAIITTNDGNGFVLQEAFAFRLPGQSPKVYFTSTQKFCANDLLKGSAVMQKVVENGGDYQEFYQQAVKWLREKSRQIK